MFISNGYVDSGSRPAGGSLKFPMTAMAYTGHSR